jgi:hypothetical protein
MKDPEPIVDMYSTFEMKGKTAEEWLEEYGRALRALIAELDHVDLAPGTSDASLRMRVRNAKRIARIALGFEFCELCLRDADAAAGRATKLSIVFHTCGRDNP